MSLNRSMGGLSNQQDNEQKGSVKNPKDNNAMVESGLHMQESLIFNLKQVLNQTKENIDGILSTKSCLDNF